MTKTLASFRLRHRLKAQHHTLSEFGFNPLNTLSFIRGLPTYLYQSIRFYLQSQKSSQSLPITDFYPCLSDRYQEAGSLIKHYFHQDLWAARKVYKNNPARHVDVGSRIDGFIAHLLTFREVEILDVRDLKSEIRGITFLQADLMNSKNLPTEIYDSVSCLHALEHFGLGRYGDPIDSEGHIKGLKSLISILKSNGQLLLSVPIGQERVEFNGHRIFSANTIVNLTNPDLELKSFSYIDDDDKIYEDVDIFEVPNLVYGCGLFEFRKK
jgi:SAM-dependent methyltransferase